VWLAALILLQLVFLGAASAMADCRGAGLAECPSSLLCLAGAVALAAAGTELQLVRPVCSWGRLATLGLTVFNVFDIFTDSLSAGVIVATHLCEESKMDEAWLQVVEQSVLPTTLPLWVVACAAWASGGLQLVLAVFLLATRGGTGTSVAGAAVADVMGFETLAAGVTDPKLLRDDDNASAANAEDEASTAEIPMDNATWQEREQARGTALLVKFGLRLGAENLFQMHVQLTSVGLSLALVGWNLASQKILVSAAFSVGFLLTKCYQFAPGIVDIAQRANFSQGNVFGKFSFVFLFALPIILVPIAGVYGILKFVAIFMCPQSLLNVTGCAEIDIP